MAPRARCFESGGRDRAQHMLLRSEDFLVKPLVIAPSICSDTALPLDTVVGSYAGSVDPTTMTPMQWFFF